MRRIYLDNAATAFPKAPGTGKAMAGFIDNASVNISRTTSREGESCYSRILSLREMIASLYSYPHPECVLFTMNVTEALNMMIKALIPPHSHVITTSSEHNAVMRPLSQIKANITRVRADRYGYAIWDDLPSLIDGNTKAIIVNAAGNVSGAAEDLLPPSEAASKHHIPLIIDAAQASPHFPISLSETDAAAICFTGHKGFLGPEGTGGAIIRRDIAERIEPLVTGGTGSESDSEEVPSSLPERLSGGTENLPGLIGLEHALSWTLERLPELCMTARRMTEKLYEGLSSVDGISIVGAPLAGKRTNVISITTDRIDLAELSYLLLERGNIETRVGLHCAPSAHRALGTFPRGTLRFSPGPFTPSDDIDTVIRVIREVL